MKVRKINPTETSEINITPMLDVVFIMLIFFIVTTSFTKETGIQLTTGNSIIHESKAPIATIKLETNDQITVNGIDTGLNGIESILANLKASNPEIQAQVFAAKDVNTGKLVQTIDQIKSNNIEKFTVGSF